MPKRGKRKGGRRFRDRYEEVEFKTKPERRGRISEREKE